MAKSREQVLKQFRDLKANIEQLFADVDHWNSTQPDEEPVDADPSGRLKATLAAINEMFTIDAAKGHRGTIDAPSMDILYPNGPKEIQ